MASEERLWFWAAFQAKFICHSASKQSRIKSSPQWNRFEVVKLSMNMWPRGQNDFSERLLKIVHGNLTHDYDLMDDNSEILPECMQRLVLLAQYLDAQLMTMTLPSSKIFK